MQLFYRNYPANKDPEHSQDDLIILHGLFGMSDNWVSIGKQLSENRRVIIPDLRNHGRSPHSDKFSTELMVSDIKQLTSDLNLSNPILLGHSMGGRVAMEFALTYPDMVSKLIVADMNMRPAKLRPEHWNIFEIMQKAPLQEMKTIQEIELYFLDQIKIKKLSLFMLKNIKKTKLGFEWKLNFPVLLESFKATSGSDFGNAIFDNPTLFLRGGNSDYIMPEDYDQIREHFSVSFIETIEDASHWIHADKPNEFVHLVKSFL